MPAAFDTPAHHGLPSCFLLSFFLISRYQLANLQTGLFICIAPRSLISACMSATDQHSISAKTLFAPEVGNCSCEERTFCFWQPDPATRNELRLGRGY